MKKNIISFMSLILVLSSCQKAAVNTNTTTVANPTIVKTAAGITVAPTTPTDAFYDGVLGQTPISINSNLTKEFKSKTNLVFHYSAFDGTVKSAKTHYSEADILGNPTYPVAYDEFNLKVAVNGTNTAPTSQLGTYNLNNYITVNGTNYYLIQYHFHYTSEHELNGKKAEMEVHFVHQSLAGKVAVVGVFINKGNQGNASLTKIVNLAPAVENATTTNLLPAFVGTSLLPSVSDREDYYTYSGSLTTPAPVGSGLELVAPYHQELRWFVFGKPIVISDAAYNKYVSIYTAENARPLQPIGSRTIFRHTN